MNSITINNWIEVPNNYTGHVKFTNGNQVWYKNGEAHREDGPAVLFVDVGQYWYKNGQFHREGGPAIIYADGAQAWYLDDKEYSREDYYRELHRRSKITEQELFVELL